MMLVERSIQIAAPAEVVRAQFGDVAHHAHTGVHAGVTFEVLSDDAELCRYRQISRTGPIRSTQVLELERHERGPLINTVVGGPFRGACIVFDIAEMTDIDAARSTVTARFESPRRIHRLMRPVIRRVVGAALTAALEEDRHDLESGSYSNERKP
jgi:hypothetical protein